MSHPLTATQSQAIEPHQSVWLSAHAGTGKTKVLIDRILRLLLQGEKPASILAITYTNAAAAEMKLRLQHKAAQWSALDDDALGAELRVIGCEDDAAMRVKARGLLVALLDAPKPIGIQTIHSFCQKLLTQFPLEAGLKSSPTLMDERQKNALLADAKAKFFRGLSATHTSALHDAVLMLNSAFAEGTFASMIDALLQHSNVLFAQWQDEAGRHATLQALNALLGTDGDAPSIAQSIPLDDAQLTSIIDVMRDCGGSKLLSAAAGLQAWITSRDEEVIEEALLNKDGKPRTLSIKAFVTQWPAHYEQLLQLQGWIVAHKQLHANARTYALSEALCVVGQALMQHYIELKHQRGLLDYNDLLYHTYQLLKQPDVCGWIFSKLDVQLQHILLDEAQDTSPLQWQLMQLLVDELFLPELYGTNPRSLFVVGDKKQSIYRFNGADVEGFARHQKSYQDFFAHTQQAFADLTLNRSFRSAPEVLSFVDAVCAQPDVQEALQEQNVQHEVQHTARAGCVSLWPLIDADKPAKLPPWESLQPDYAQQDKNMMLARRIAQDIAARIKRKQARAGDIMILLQKRKELFHALQRALQEAGVPQAGADRLFLRDHPAVRDCIIAAQWCLLPQDDLALATLLKSPLFGWDDAQLFDVAYARSSTLWEALQASEHRAEIALLSQLQASALQQRPYAWFTALLYQHGMAEGLRAELGSEADDALEAFCEMALKYERENIADLGLFVAWFDAANAEVKREMEQGAQGVRIMTIHGAKGLQAPIVYLPDTLFKSRASKEVTFLPTQQGWLLPLVRPDNAKSAILADINEATKIADRAEKYRQFYVAMTRAETELIICGAGKESNSAVRSWHALAQAAFDALPADYVSTDAHTGEMQFAMSVAPLLQETSPPSRPITLPDWLRQPSADAQIIKPRARAASSLVDKDEAAFSVAADSNAAQRGTWLHQLLQMLPAHMPDDQTWQNIARSILPPAADAEQLAQEALAVHQAHPWMFAKGSHAEVSVCGEVMLEGKPQAISGQIDRLLVDAAAVHIIDYKSGAPPDVLPPAYVAQLAAYRALLAPLYPAHSIRAALLWTQSAQLEYVDAPAMNALCMPANAA
jgi:ATP-dependent helicase/nuclease subunit A